MKKIMRYVICLCLCGLPALFLTGQSQEDSGLVFSVSSGFNTALKGAVIKGDHAVLNGRAEHPPIRLDEPIKGDFLITASVRMSKSDANGMRMIATLLNARGDQAFLRVIDGVVDLRMRLDGVWHRVSSTANVPLDRWTLVGGLFKNGRLYCIVDGLVDGVQSGAKISKVEPFDTLLVARYEKGQGFKGDLQKLGVYNKAINVGKLAKKWGLATAADAGAVDLSTQAPPEFPPEKALRVTDETVHPIVDSGGANVTMVPWSGPKGKEMISTGAYGLYAPRAGLLRPIGLDKELLAKGLSYPLYDQGETLLFRGLKLEVIPRPDGLFDLITYGGDTVFGNGYLTYYRNTGKVGDPFFKTAIRKGVNDESVLTALGDAVHSWSLGDLDGDGKPDLILITRDASQQYSPDGVSVWSANKHPNAGKGRGFDVAGNWMGQRLRTKVYWARGHWDSANELAFQEVQPIYYGDDDFQVQWHTEGLNVHAGVLRLKGTTWLLLAGDVDRVVALPVINTDGALRCGESQPFLENDARVVGTYFNSVFSFCDLDDDGNTEVIMSGNTGRPTVLKGTSPGNFKEVGTLNRKGGFVEMDTLAVPFRIDWNGDGFADVIAGDASGWLWFWPGTNKATVFGRPVLFTCNGNPVHHIAGPRGSLQGPSESGWGYLNPTVGDWADDGNLAIITNDIKGDMILYRPVSKGATELLPPRQFMYKGKKLPTAWRSRPAILPAALCSDGVPKLIMMDWDGDLAVAQPVEKGGIEINTITKLFGRRGQPLRFCATYGGNWGRTKFAVTDWDRDGRWDLVFGTVRLSHRHFLPKDEQPDHATPLFLRNIGTNASPVFADPVPIRKKDGSLIYTGHHICAVQATDLDGDGNDDLIMGSEDGKIYYFWRSELKTP